ncbi:TPA: hypothetical protein ACNVV3_002705 [Pseudomonas putida]
MIIRFFWRRWSPPELTPEQRLNVSLNVTEKGVAYYVLRFLCIPTERNRKEGIGWRRFFDYWGSGIGMALFSLIGLAIAAADFRNELINIVGLCGVLMIPTTLVYFLSVLVVAFRYSAWLKSLRQLSVPTAK